MIRLFDFIDNIRLRKKNIYFQYSEDEQFTGDYWIDGKKIYQKTVIWTSTLSTASQEKISHGIADIDNIIKDETFALNNNESRYTFPVIYYQYGGSGNFYDSYVTARADYIYYWTNTSWSGYTFYTTLRYTKK